ncbi:hypothetical protein A9Q87_08130 [Flavobacteriales bacterium 34_180_T64]|nr:hypothetical protein A9Q87_08130 [Flavobacteriales bacterium 34_180_T64]
MNLNIKSKLNKLYKSSWFITLFATTLGVLLAFYLNNLNSRSKIESRKLISIQNLNNELLNNKTALLDSKDNERLIDFLSEIKELDHEFSNELITATNTMMKLKTSYSDFIEIRDSIGIRDDLYKYNVAYQFELNLDDLQNIAWETSKMSNITNELNYDCLQVLVKVYSLQEIFTNEQQKIINHFVNAEHDKLLGALLIVQQLKSQLMNVMIEGQKEINNCD